ncbi:DUF971 domain-containing protein [Roseimaritima ulvae]|uniref:Gamma-butyrobetaine hydroxylase-like N-terminal domain-containing protein n=1 Tax=Roseimaritima ulvae TaxID=980254 RepID=A0A5B9QLC0_9BACT|nr:DUF971 domain-containing protein [Roseimaritima ulvae]QEG38370.1 hypothetical protein UC8_03270 [Roseimaritima ulvae]
MPINDTSSSSEPILPTGIERGAAGQVVIQWSDQQRTVHTASQLRKACPCASCREKRKAKAEDEAQPSGLLPVLSAAEAQPLEIAAMRPAGQYAYNIQFSDGHNSGLFTFDLLRELGEG